MTQSETGAIAQVLSDIYGRGVPAEAIVPMDATGGREQAPDATRKFLAPTPQGGRGVLLLSSAGNGALVARAVANIKTARAAVSPATAAPILTPAAAGEAGGCSFAVWPRHVPFASDARLTRLWRRQRHGGAVLAWGADFARETAVPADLDAAGADLRAIAGNELLPATMRRDAQAALSRLKGGAWHPIACLQHGDFWAGNVLLPRGRADAGFFVIDWAGMLPAGYPFFDLARMLVSLNLGAARRRRHLEGLAGALGIAPDDVGPHLLAALGAVGRNLEHFPPEMYRAMAEETYRAATAA